MSGVLCDRRMCKREDQGEGVQNSGKTSTDVRVQRETWALKKTQENKLEIAEMRMLRWISIIMCVVTKLEKIRNE